MTRTHPEITLKGRHDTGQVMAFTAAFLSAMLLFAGLVIDGGLALAAKTRALGLAGEAARAGAQQIDPLTYRATGDIRLDPAAAGAAARAHLHAAKATGSVTVDGDEVRVTARIHQPAQLLRLAGIAVFTLTGSASAAPHRGGTTLGP